MPWILPAASAFSWADTGPRLLILYTEYPITDAAKIRTTTAAAIRPQGLGCFTAIGGGDLRPPLPPLPAGTRLAAVPLLGGFGGFVSGFSFAAMPGLL